MAGRIGDGCFIKGGSDDEAPVGGFNNSGCANSGLSNSTFDFDLDEVGVVGMACNAGAGTGIGVVVCGAVCNG